MEAQGSPRIRFDPLDPTDLVIGKRLEAWRRPSMSFPLLAEDDSGRARLTVEAQFEGHLARCVRAGHQARAGVSEECPAIRCREFHGEMVPAGCLRFEVDVTGRSRRQVEVEVIEAARVWAFIRDEIGLTGLRRTWISPGVA
jgi:hypothetical protein